MNTFLSLLGTYTLFALWQATFWLAAVWILGRFYRKTPWKAHFLSVTGIFVATLTPLLSTIVSVTSGGLLENSAPQWIESQTLGAACFTGMSLFIVLLSYGIAMSRKLMFHAVPYPNRESQDALLRHSKTLRNVSLPILFTSPSVKSPTVWCWGLHPAVLLPESLAEGLRDVQRDAVFLHELSHVIRRDHLTSLLVRLCGALLFWNPLYWLVLWESDLASDESCDLLVLTQGQIPAEQYTETLLRLVAGERRRPILQFLSRKEKIMRRIDRILSFENLPSPVGSRLWTASVFVTTLLLSVTLAFCQGEKTAQETKTSEKIVSKNPTIRQFQSPAWILDQEGQERPMYDQCWNGHSTMTMFRFCMRIGNGNDKWLNVTPEQKKKFRFLSKPQEIGVEWFQKKRTAHDPELMKAYEEIEKAKPKGDPQLRRATEEQKRAYVKASCRPSELFGADVSRQLEEALTPEQLEKLRSLEFMLLPEMGIPCPAMFDCLGLFDAQQKKVDAIREELRPEFEKLLDERMEARKTYLEKMVDNLAVLDKETPFESEGEVLEAMNEAAMQASRDKAVGRKQAESDRRQKEFTSRLKERLAELLTPEQKKKMQTLIDAAPEFAKQQFGSDDEEKSPEKQPERIRNYRVDKKVTEFPADVIDLSTPEAAYALGNRIIAGDETDRLERLRLLTVRMNIPKDMKTWINTMPAETKTLLKNAEILNVIIYKDKSAMLIAEVVKGEKYNNRLFTKQDGQWLNVGGGGFYNGKSAEEVVKMCEGMFAKLADRWDGEKEEKVWKTPDVVEHTFLATFEPTGDFEPATAQELLDKLNGPLFKHQNIVTGYFRTSMDGGRMTGRICTNNPTGLREVFRESPELKLLKLEPLNEKRFEEHLGEKVKNETNSGTTTKSLKDLVKIDGIKSYRVDKKPSDFPDEISLKTPENAYASIKHLLASSRKDKVEQLEKMSDDSPKLTDGKIPAAEQTNPESLSAVTITEVLLKENLAFVLGRHDDGLCDGCLFVLKNGQWLRLGNFQTETLDEMAKGINENYSEIIKTLGIMPPKIVKLEPENGAKEVDPATIKEIRVTFDRDMNTSGWSWCGGGDTYPKTTDKPRYIDKRTCVMPVELAEKKGYWIGINSFKFKNFQSADGVPVEPVLYSFTTKGADLTPPRVIKFEPADGATDVDAETIKELRITFDRDMMPGMSWCSIGGLTPEMGEANWIDKRTCVMKVAMKPNRNYLVGINAPMFDNFRSETGVPAKPVPYSFSTKKDQRDGDEGKHNPRSNPGATASTPTPKSFEDAPVVAKLEPANGATDVDAATVKQLRVTFDVDMNTTSFSWCGGGEQFPKTTDKPKWIDKRTCVLPVELEPGKNYRLGINAPSFKGFQNKNGVPVEPLTYEFSTK